ncbi:hypothetical protein Nmel_018484 [Mimus melanotis]
MRYGGGFCPTRHTFQPPGFLVGLGRSYGGSGYGIEGGFMRERGTAEYPWMEVGPCRGWEGFWESLTPSAQCQGRWCHRGAGTWHWEAPALAGGSSGGQCGRHWRGLGGVSGPFFGCRAGSCVRSCVPMGRPPWTPLRCSPSIPAAPLHASSLGTWWGFGGPQDGDRGLGEDPSFYGGLGVWGGSRSLWRGHPAVWGD